VAISNVPPLIEFVCATATVQAPASSEKTMPNPTPPYLNLPFSKRTTTAVTIFAAMQAAKQAYSTLGVAQGEITTAQAIALRLQNAQLFVLYRKVIHQDVPNQAEVLAGIITSAVTTITALNETMQSIEPTFVTQTEVSMLQILTANALAQITNVEFVEQGS
jgi:hypothetical protein